MADPDKPSSNAPPPAEDGLPDDWEAVALPDDWEDVPSEPRAVTPLSPFNKLRLGSPIEIPSNAEAGKRLRTLAEYGVPLAVGFGAPEVAIAPLTARLIMMGLSGAGTSELTEGLDPTEPDQRAPLLSAMGFDVRGPHGRALESGLLNMGGEGLGIAATGAARGVGRLAERVAPDLARRGLGFMYQHLHRMGLTESPRAAEIALQEGIVGPRSSQSMARTAIERAQQANTTLQDLRQRMAAAGGNVDALGLMTDVDQALRNWRPGVSHEPEFAAHLDEIVNDIAAHADPVTGEIDPQALMELKNLLGNQARMNAIREMETRTGQLASRSNVARGMTREAEDVMAQQALSPDDAALFAREKEVFGAMQDLIDPRFGALMQRAQRDMGNDVAGLPVLLAALGGSNGVNQLLRGVGARGVRQYGAQSGAWALDRIARGLLSPELDTTIRALTQAGAQQAGGRPLLQGLGLAPAEGR